MISFNIDKQKYLKNQSFPIISRQLFRCRILNI
nr:MAG TPA: hypothetical protein [Caudoviricetes sp.]